MSLYTRAAVVVAFVAPAALWLGLRASLIDRVAAAAAAELAFVAQLAEPAEPPEPVTLAPLPGAEAVAALDPGRAAEADDGDGAAENPPQSPAASARTKAPAAGGIFVPRARVDAAVKAGARPASGGAAPKTAWRPAGTIVVGVGHLGVGLRDGDVVTRVGGTPATSVNAVVGAVHAALRAGAPAITAEVWRGEHRIFVTVELPELKRRPRRARGDEAPVSAEAGPKPASHSAETAPGPHRITRR